ncbi:MAG: heat-shock protein [Alphaproteobacteria bacterium]|nr:MAG: heat-shock protein [Alphaproteobacteria bacterium]
MRTFDLSPLMRSTVGFENLNRLVDYVTRLDAGDVAYPPYDIAKLDEDRYRISMAVAGFKRDELDIMVQDNVLTVSAKAGESEDDTVYLHRGIARRAFERRFQLADTVKVVGADLVDGLLNIELVREVPEHMKPRQIKIGSGPLKAKLLKPKAA